MDIRVSFFWRRNLRASVRQRSLDDALPIIAQVYQSIVTFSLAESTSTYSKPGYG